MRRRFFFSSVYKEANNLNFWMKLNMHERKMNIEDKNPKLNMQEKKVMNIEHINILYFNF